MIKLFPYQLEGVEWLAKQKRALLADEMGLGKTAQAIVAAKKAGYHKILVICPAIARYNWCEEFQKFGDRVDAVPIINRKDLQKERAITVCSFDGFKNYFEVLNQRYDLLIVDEAHFLKNPAAKRTQMILGKAGVIHKVKAAWFLSGTPAPNHGGEMWVYLFLFGRTKLKHDAFIKKFCDYYVPPHYNAKPQVTGTKKAMIPELRKLISPIMLRRRKEEVMPEMPKVRFQDLYVDPGKFEIELYSTLAQWALPEDRRGELKQKLERQQALVNEVFANNSRAAAFEQLAAISNSISELRRYWGVRKIEPVVKLLKDELENKVVDKIVVFAIHADVIRGIYKGVMPHGSKLGYTLYGGTPPEKRDRQVRKFQADPNIKLIVANILAAGTSITLTAAHHVVFVEQDFVPGNNVQALNRVHRIGQDKPVLVRNILIRDSIDQKIGAALMRKTRELDQIFNPEKKS